MKSSIILTYLIALCVVPITGCKGPEAGSETAARSRAVTESKQYIVLVDMSVSRDDKSHLDALQFLQRLAKSLHFGDQFLVLPVQQDGVRDGGEVAKATMPVARNVDRPSPDDESDLEAERRNASEALPHFFKEQAKQKLLHTDLLATLAIAGDYVRERRTSSSEIIILSDMLQSAQGVEMEKAQRMPAKNWIAQQEAHHQLPDFKGACIAVIGEDKTSQYDPQIREFWTKYFKATGSELNAGNIWFSPPDDMTALCR